MNQTDITTCTIKPASNCTGCSIAGQLKCRFKWGDLLHFMAMFVGFAIPAVIGLIRGGYGCYLVGWIGFMLFFFNVWEIRILCSHCPYYAEDSLVLHCIANHGCLKLWKYHPEPMSTSEKVQLFIGFVLLCGFPLPFLLLSQQWVLAAISAWMLIFFFWTLKKYVCSACVNFSCPLNSVPKPTVDAYLMRNPVMREAWEKSGWEITNRPATIKTVGTRHAVSKIRL
jgi:hypothetical protein